MLSPLLSWVLSFLFSSILDLRFLNPPLRLVFVVCVSPLSPSCRVRDFRLCFFLSRGFSTGRLAWMSFLFLSFRPFASIYKYPYIHISKIVSSLSALGTRTSPCLFHISTSPHLHTFLFPHPSQPFPHYVIDIEYMTTRFRFVGSA